MAWEYYKEEEKYCLQNYTVNVSAMDIRGTLLNLHETFGDGATDYALFGFAYGCDLFYKFEKMSWHEFSGDNCRKWFYSEYVETKYHRLHICFKNETDVVMAKLLLENFSK
jgi:hypothetical protein